MAFIELHNLTKQFGPTTVVSPLNLAVERGEFLSVLGPSGCGKTTTLRMIAGFEAPSGGSIKIDGADITRTPPSKRKIGIVFQSYALFPNMSVAQNIGYGLQIAKLSKQAIQQRVDEMLAIIHMQEFANRYPHQLSGGQQQRVALARALAIRPQVLLLDEPLSALDAKIRVSLRQDIRAIQRELGITAIYVTHDQEEALSLSDRVLIMQKGEVEQLGTPAEIYNNPKTSFVAQFVGTLNTLEATLHDAKRGILQFGSQQFEVSDSFDAALQGTTVQVALRPERLSLNGAVSQNQLHGVVKEQMLLGPIVRFHVEVEQHLLFVDVFNDTNVSRLPNRGEAVVVNFAPHDCLVLAR
ncbi:ABC transporter ATP-binding protein [Herpetosiphon giganteus]|uniref:ABC transporter ATP-binding protein n=1 Tax=Herpetosiphon giganteus TaxID=2029754 RepID=UPI00195AD5BB|nr:ABC transporter ATP-binding protein [Herpetosiphon giganteus]MBM7846606.1 putative spermidine/putrescine transport system ATP-binding protein [Herpetosiphon giganteus]